MELKTMWSEFYGGTITVKICKTLDEIPSSARYKYDDDETELSIYCDDNDQFYGVKL